MNLSDNFSANLPKYRDWQVWLKRSDDVDVGPCTRIVPERSDFHFLGPLYLAWCGRVLSASLVILAFLAMLVLSTVNSWYWIIPALSIWIASPEVYHRFQRNYLERHYEKFGSFSTGSPITESQARANYNENLRHYFALGHNQKDEQLREIVKVSYGSVFDLSCWSLGAAHKLPDLAVRENYREKALLYVVEVSEATMLEKLLSNGLLQPVTDYVRKKIEIERKQV